jgi:hypothetical protein
MAKKALVAPCHPTGFLAITIWGAKMFELVDDKFWEAVSSSRSRRSGLPTSPAKRVSPENRAMGRPDSNRHRQILSGE